jgi:hypothetical protein
LTFTPLRSEIALPLAACNYQLFSVSSLRHAGLLNILL